MNNSLLELQRRIKGARLSICRQRVRVYIPYCPIGYSSKIKTTVFFEIINDRLKLFVEVSSEYNNIEWCEMESDKIKNILLSQFFEVINDCELKRKKIPLNIRLEDNVDPLIYSADPFQKKAIQFLCSMKVSALLADSIIERIFIAIRLAQSRYRAQKINKLHVILPFSMINEFKKNILLFWNAIPVSVLFTSIESISHSKKTYMKAQNYTDSQTMLIVEECHLIKSCSAIRSIRIVEISQKCNYKLIMTDSLIVNNIHDIYMQFKVLSDLILGYRNWADFGKKHIIYGGIGGNQILGYKNLSHLAGLVEPYTYAIDSKPIFQRNKLSTHTYFCYLTYKQKYYYKQRKNELLSLIDKNEIQVYDVFKALTELQKITCGYQTNKDGQVELLGSQKYTLLDKYAGNGQCVIFCKFLLEIKLLTNHLGRENCAVFSGKNKKKKSMEKTLFIKNQKRFFISTIAIPEIDLNDLRECSHFIFFSISFKYLEYSRCIAHIKRKVINDPLIIRFVTDSGIDKKIINNLYRKGKLSDDVHQLLLDKTKLKIFANSL